MKILHLTLKKQWFDMILSGEKKEEYREAKPYWAKRLVTDIGIGFEYKEFDVVRFKLGYSKNAPTMDVVCKEVNWCDMGNENWGFEQPCYVIRLGEILSTENIPTNVD